jgi:XTP/dITP diphosphohydrolase
VQRIALATRSEGKLRELEPMLRDAGFAPVTLLALGIPHALEEEAIERYATFRENALSKAKYFYARCGGLPVVAEDSGLEVAALGGGPGVRSKRWAGRPDLDGEALDEANNARLIAALRGVDGRVARYVCEAVWADASGILIARGESEGTIIDEPRGSAGFGYDPHFLSNELGVTFAEVSMEEKAKVSHRARALRGLLLQLRPQTTER